MSSNVELFENLMNPSKEIREKAEKELENLKHMPIETSATTFINGIQSANENIAQLSALLLKKSYFENAESRQKISIEVAKGLQDMIKQQINFNTRSWKTLQRLGDDIAILYDRTGLVQGLSEIVNWFNDQSNAVSRKFAIYLICMLCEFNILKQTQLDDNANENFLMIFKQGLTDSNIDVKVNTLKAVTQFLTGITNETIVMKYSSLVDSMLDTLIASLKYELSQNTDIEKDSSKTALETLTLLMDVHPKFCKSKISQIIHIVGEISRTTAFPNRIRESSLELVFTLCTNSPKAVKKTPNFKTEFLPLIFELLLEVDNINNLEEWEKQNETDEVDLNDMYYAVRDSFDRLSTSLGGEYIMTETAPLIQKCIQSQNWIEIHAGFTALGYMAEGCKESFKKHLLELMNYISPALTHQHPRVKYIALFAFGSILKETSPELQKQYSNNILPALAQLMGNNEPSIRVKTSSCTCLVEFLRGLLNKEKEKLPEVEVIKPYSGDLVKLISNLFEFSLSVNYAPLQDETLCCLSLLSNLLEKEFAPYYQNIMPGLKKLFIEFKAETNEQKTLKSNCIETISYLCASVSENPENYMNDLNEISQGFVNYMQNLPEEDPQLSTIINSFCNISLSMKDKFIPILNVLLPYLSKYINADIGLKIEDATLAEYIPEENAAENEIGKIGSVLFNVGSQSAKLSLHTFALQNKLLAYNALNDIAINMKTSFCSFTDTLVNFSKNLMKFPYSRKIRKLSIKAILSSICACTQDEQKKYVIDTLFPVLFQQWELVIKSKFLKEIKCILKYLSLIVQELKYEKFLSEQYIGKIYTLLKSTAELLRDLKNGILEKVINSKDDDEDEELLAEDFDALDEILRRIMEVNGNIFKIIKSKMTALVTTSLYEIYDTFWNEQLKRKKFKSDQEILNSLCFFDDYLEYSDISAYNMVYPEFLKLTENSKTENEDLLQSLAYGYGILCKRTDKKEFLNIKATVVTFIGKIIQNENIGGYTRDNAIGALGRYLYFQSNLEEQDINMFNTYLKLIPIKEDLEECKNVFKELYDQINASNPIVANQNNIPQIKDTLMRFKELNDNEHFLQEYEPLLRELFGKFGI